MIDAVNYICVFLMGIITGSFLNVCVYRIPLGQSIIKSPSHCTHCGTRIKYYDLIPLLSYIILLGRCRSCKTKINLRYPLVELVNGLGFVYLYLFYGLSITFVFSLMLLSTLIVVSLIDFEHTVIPDGIIIFLLVTGILYNIAMFSLPFTVSNIIGFFAASVPLLIMAVATNGGMGGGDIKLMAVCGLFTGWQNIIFAMFTGAVLAGIGVLIRLIIKGKKEKTIPFGPFLSMGVMIGMLYGESMIEWYLRLTLGDAF